VQSNCNSSEPASDALKSNLETFRGIQFHPLIIRWRFPPPIRSDPYSQQKKIPFFLSSSVRCFVKPSTALCARATPVTTATTSSVLGTPDESRTDFRTSQWEVSGFRRGTGTEGILAIQVVGGHDTEGLLLARLRDRLSIGVPEKPRAFGMRPVNGE